MPLFVLIEELESEEITQVASEKIRQEPLSYGISFPIA